MLFGLTVTILEPIYIKISFFMNFSGYEVANNEKMESRCESYLRCNI